MRLYRTKYFSLLGVGKVLDKATGKIVEEAGFNRQKFIEKYRKNMENKLGMKLTDQELEMLMEKRRKAAEVLREHNKNAKEATARRKDDIASEIRRGGNSIEVNPDNGTISVKGNKMQEKLGVSKNKYGTWLDEVRVDEAGVANPKTVTANNIIGNHFSNGIGDRKNLEAVLDTHNSNVINSKVKKDILLDREEAAEDAARAAKKVENEKRRIQQEAEDKARREQREQQGQQNQQPQNNQPQSNLGRNLVIGTGVTLGTGALAYGGYKLANRNKNKQQPQNNVVNS